MGNGGINLKLIRKGAEAHLYKDKWFGRNVIKKVRISNTLSGLLWPIAVLFDKDHLTALGAEVKRDVP